MYFTIWHRVVATILEILAIDWSITPSSGHWNGTSCMGRFLVAPPPTPCMTQWARVWSLITCHWLRTFAVRSFPTSWYKRCVCIGTEKNKKLASTSRSVIVVCHNQNVLQSTVDAMFPVQLPLSTALWCLLGVSLLSLQSPPHSSVHWNPVAWSALREESYCSPGSEEPRERQAMAIRSGGSPLELWFITDFPIKERMIKLPLARRRDMRQSMNGSLDRWG